MKPEILQSPQATRAQASLRDQSPAIAVAVTSGSPSQAMRKSYST